MSKQRLVLIDGNAIIHRAYHAIPPLTVKDGTMVNAVYGFASMLIKTLKDLNPTHIVVCFDVAGGTFRDELFVDYKAKRVKADEELYKQIPLIYELVQSFQIPIFTKEGYEADDVIGTLIAQTRQEERKKKTNNPTEIIVVTGDRDLLQLVGANTSVYLLKKGLSEMEMYTPDKVIEHFGFPASRVADYKALCGDTSDNIPGVKGIGEKTATELITKIGGIDEIYKDLKEGKVKLTAEFRSGVIDKLEAGEKDAYMSRELGTIHQSVPGLQFQFSDCAVVALEKEKLSPVFQKFEFFSLLKRAFPESAPEEDGGMNGKKGLGKSGKTKPKKISGEDINLVIQKIKTEKKFVCEAVLSGADVFSDRLLSLFIGLPDGVYDLQWDSFDTKARDKFSTLLLDPEIMLIGHDVKKIVKVFSLHQTPVQCSLFDVMIASYLLNSSTRSHELSGILFRELGIEMPQEEQQSLFGGTTSKQTYARELREVFMIYEKRLRETENLGLFHTIEMALIPVLAHMELSGIALDTPLLHKLSEELKKRIENLNKKIWELAGVEFNVASSVQLRDVLFEKLKLGSGTIKKGKTGYSTAASELEKLRGEHPIIECIEEHRELSKLQNTYVEPLPGLVHPITKRIHTTYNQAVAATGRLSSTDPNLQNIPIRTDLGKEIRQAFVAAPGHIFVAADYSQIELRIVASLAEDEKLMEIFAKGEDVHTATAATILGVPLSEVTKEMRRSAKEINFGVLYGMSTYGLSSRTGITPAEAKEFIKTYFQEFSGVKKYLDSTLELAKKTGYVETLFGRRRYIPELSSTNFQLRNSGERMAVNMPIQGTAADLMKMAMIAVYNKIQNEPDVKMILQVHDELVLEVPVGEEKRIAKILKDTMENVATLRVPILVESAVAERWGELK